MTTTETPTTTRFRFHSDPGHGWLEVGLADLRDVGLRATQFSSYSYRHGDRLYLEEDCDATLFLKAYEARFGRVFAFDAILETRRDSPIRGMRRNAGTEYDRDKTKTLYQEYDRLIALRQEVEA